MFTEFQGLIGEKGDTFIRLFKPALLDEINHQYQIEEYLPGYQLIGSNAALEGIFVAPNTSVVQIPFIPLRAQYARTMFSSVQQFQDELNRSFASDLSYPLELTRMAVHPIALGGSPTDPANFKDVPEEIHVKSTVYWNSVYIHALKKKAGN